MPPPTVHFTGATDHADFRDAVATLRAEAELVDVANSPELIVVAQSRPGEVSAAEVHRLRRAAPLAGLVGLVGSWCEGETRTGQPWPGVARFYWHEFPLWWRRQLQLRAAGRCPDWAQPADTASLPGMQLAGPPPTRQTTANTGSVIVLRVGVRDTADALTDVFRRAGFAVVWQRPGRDNCPVRGATAGVWDGGQLDEHELNDLATFCQQMARDRAAVVALLDFPRRHNVDAAHACGAAAVLGKPWRNTDLVAFARLKCGHTKVE